MKRCCGVYVLSFRDITNIADQLLSASLLPVLGTGLPVGLASHPEQPHTLWSKTVSPWAGDLVQLCTTLASYSLQAISIQTLPNPELPWPCSLGTC
jgi:hypothetical protein